MFCSRPIYAFFALYTGFQHGNLPFYPACTAAGRQKHTLPLAKRHALPAGGKHALPLQRNQGDERGSVHRQYGMRRRLDH